MYIKKLTIQNVKSFRQKTVLELGRGVNFLVGDNNGGKSTVLEALLFLFEGPTATKWRPDTFYSTDADGPTSVTVDISGGVEKLVEQPKYSQLKSFVFDEGGENILRLQRSSEQRTVAQNGGKDKNVDVKAVCFWHPERAQFENVTGIDARVKAIFDFEAIWADAQPGDHIDFANTKTLGRLLDAAFKRFAETDHWQNLVAAHEKAFADDEKSFLVETNRLAKDIKALVDEQYGHAAMRFEFSLPDPSVFMKQGRLHVDDGAGETPVEGKGSGMQRAIALGIIQLYAKSEALADPENPTPLILMLDEPETWLHPSAQLRLGDALSAIGEREQVFIITHSPYLIRKFDSRSHQLAVFVGQGSQRKIDTSTAFGLFGVGEPTWGEINYRAFGICSHEFHNELYGYVQKHLDDQKPEGQHAYEWEVDDFLVSRGFARTKEWLREGKSKQDRTLPVYVRNFIHHPENKKNVPVTDVELRSSTEELVNLVETMVSTGRFANTPSDGDVAPVASVGHVG